MPACFSRIRRTTAALADFHATCNDEFATQGFGCRRGCRGVPNASPPRIQPVASSESSTPNKKRRRCAAKSPRNARSNALASCSAHARRTKKPLASVDARGFPIEKASESISRVLSLDDHLSRTCVAARLKHATRTHGRAAVSRSYLRLLQMGFSKPRCCQRAGALLPHRFSFSPACAGEFTFLWHFPSSCPAQPLAGILPFGARTFLTPQPRRAIAWPTRVWYSTIPNTRQGAS